MLEVMEIKIHGLLKGRTSIFETKRHLTIRECTPWTIECCFVLVLGFDLYLIISQKLSMKEKASQPTHSSIIWSMNGVGKLSFGQALFKSWKFVHTRIVPCFLLTGTGFDTHWVKWIG
jgi:hypothetical protein